MAVSMKSDRPVREFTAQDHTERYFTISLDQQLFGWLSF